MLFATYNYFQKVKFLSKKSYHIASKIILAAIMFMPILFLSSCVEQPVNMIGPKYMKLNQIKLNVSSIKVNRPERVQGDVRLARMLGMSMALYVKQWVDSKCVSVGGANTALFDIVQASLVESGDSKYTGKIVLKLKLAKDVENYKDVTVTVEGSRKFPKSNSYQMRVNVLQDLVNQLITDLHQNLKYQLAKKHSESLSKTDNYL